MGASFQWFRSPARAVSASPFLAAALRAAVCDAVGAWLGDRKLVLGRGGLGEPSRRICFSVESGADRLDLPAVGGWLRLVSSQHSQCTGGLYPTLCPLPWGAHGPSLRDLLSEDLGGKVGLGLVGLHLAWSEQSSALPGASRRVGERLRSPRKAPRKRAGLSEQGVAASELVCPEKPFFLK